MSSTLIPPVHDPAPRPDVLEPAFEVQAALRELDALAWAPA